MAPRRRRQAQKHDYVHRPMLDSFLTAGTLVLAVIWLSMLASQSTLVLGQFCLWFCVTIAAIYGSRKFFLAVGPKIGMAEAMSKPRNIRKFADQGWQLFVHVAMTALELKILLDCDFKFWTDTKTLWTTDPVEPLITQLYLMQVAIWLFTAISHRFLEARHKDYYVMYSHHFITIFLVVGSYCAGATRVGMLVLFLHDAPDVIVDLVKMVNYLGLDEKSGTCPCATLSNRCRALPPHIRPDPEAVCVASTDLVEFFFALNLLTWFLFRLWWYPRVAISSAWFESSLYWAEEEPELLSTLGSWYKPEGGSLQYLSRSAEVLSKGYAVPNALRIGLSTLVFLHAWWYFLFLRILWKLVTGVNAHDAGREDYEGASSDSDAATDNPSHHED